MKPASPPLLILDRVMIRVPKGPVLAENLNVELYPGKALLIRGANGSGKTTLLKALLGMLLLEKGQVKWQIPAHRRGYLPQLQAQQTHLPFLLSDILSSPTASLALGLLEARHLKTPWNAASGGERKRALLSRILLEEPEALILDEPLNHLDQESRRLIIYQVKAFLAHRNAHRVAIIVSHDSSWEEELGKDACVRVEL